MENIPATEIKYCFIDTNILIHFQTFDEVDWCSVLAANEIVLMLAPVVMRELNKHKDDSNNEWRQKRARKLLSKLKELLKDFLPGHAAALRKGVRIQEIPREPKIDWVNLGLDPQVNDDRLLATIVEFTNERSLENIVLISDDFPVQRKAAIYEITTVEPETILHRIERPSAQAAKIEALQRNLDSFQNQSAKLEFDFWEQRNITNSVIRTISLSKIGWQTDKDVAKVVAEKEVVLEGVINRAQRNEINHSDIEDFKEEYQKYIERLKRTLIWQRSRDFGPSCELTFIIKNTGSAPAVDVETWLYFPENYFIVGVSKNDAYMWDEAWVPNEPEPEWEKVRDLLSTFVPPTLSKHPREPKPCGPLYDWKYRSAVAYKHPKLRQKSEWVMPSIRVYLDPSAKGGFKVEYSVEADNISAPVEGHLSVVLRHYN